MANTRSRIGTPRPTGIHCTRQHHRGEAGTEQESNHHVQWRVTIRDAEGHTEKRWLATNSEFRDVLRGEFRLNMSDPQIDEWIAVMKAKGTGDAPHPFFA